LNKEADALAEHLRAVGLQCEGVVALMIPGTPELAAAMLAVLKAGGAFAPLDPSSPQARSLELLITVGAAFVIHRSQVPPPPGYNALRFELGRLSTRLTEPLVVERFPDQLAYVICTSGTMGRPKGVMIEEAGLANLIHWHARAHSVAPGIRAS